MNKFISDRQNPEENQMTRSLHFKPGWPFYIAPYEQFISGWPSPERLAKPRKDPNDQICTFAPYEQFISGWPSPEEAKLQI